MTAFSDSNQNSSPICFNFLRKSLGRWKQEPQEEPSDHFCGESVSERFVCDMCACDMCACVWCQRRGKSKTACINWPLQSVKQASITPRNREIIPPWLSTPYFAASAGHKRRNMYLRVQTHFTCTNPKITATQSEPLLWTVQFRRMEHDVRHAYHKRKAVGF